MIFKDWLSFQSYCGFALRFLFPFQEDGVSDLCDVCPWAGYQLQNEVFALDQMHALCFLR